MGVLCWKAVNLKFKILPPTENFGWERGENWAFKFSGAFFILNAYFTVSLKDPLELLAFVSLQLVSKFVFLIIGIVLFIF